MKRFRVTALILCIATLFTLFLSACSPSDPNPNTASTGGTGTTTTQPSTGTDDPYAEHLTIKWLGHNQGGYLPENGTYAQKLIEEKFNVTIEPMQVDIFNAEQWSLFWAEGNTADLINHGGNVTLMYQLADQGLLRTIDEAWLWEKMPNWMGKLTDLLGEDVVKDQLKYKGQNYFVPYKNYSGVQTIIMALRADWMEAVGVTALPTNLDELHDLFLKFAKEDPDQNGKDDTYALDPILWNNGFNYIAGAFGIMPNAFYNENGKVNFTMASENWKEFMKLMRQWYLDGIIDPEFPTDDRAIQRQKWAEGKIGALMDHPWWFAQSTSNNLQEQITSQNPNAKVVFSGDIEGPHGRGGYLLYPNVASQGAVFFGKDTTDAQVERIMAIKEYIATDWDFFVSLYYGQEGENYTVTSEGKVATIPEKYTPEIITKQGLGQYYALMPLDNGDFPKFTANSDMPPYEISMSNNGIYGDGPNFADEGTNTAKIERGGDVTGIANNYFFDVLAGRKDLDQTWNDYLAELDAAGLGDILKGYEEMLAS